MINNIIYYIVTSLCITSILMAFFKVSTLIPLCLHILKTLGYKRKDPSFWDAGNLHVSPLDLMFEQHNIKRTPIQSPLKWTCVDLDVFLKTHLSTFCYSLLQCRYCFSYHVVLWVNVLCSIILTFIMPYYNISFITYVIAIITQPFVVNWLFNLLHDNSIKPNH